MTGERGAAAPSRSSTVALSIGAADIDGLPLRVTRSGDIWLGGQQLNEVQLRGVLEAHGFAVPVATQARYDTTVDDRSGWRFLLTSKWGAAAVVAAGSVVAASLAVAGAIRAIAADVAQGGTNAIATPLLVIVCTVLYLATGMVMYGYAVREKHRGVNRLDPRMWVRELRRVQRLGHRPLSDAEIEDAILDGRTPTAAPRSPGQRARRLEA